MVSHPKRSGSVVAASIAARHFCRYCDRPTVPPMSCSIRVRPSGDMQSPTVQAKVQANPQVQQMLKTRAAQLQHQLDQRQNAQTGKFLGTKPMMEEMTNQ